MVSNPVVENVLGTMGTICWSGQIIPQIWKSYREKNTHGLSPLLMLIWGASSVFLGAYAILQHLNIPLQLQPQLFGFLGFLSWGQCLYYDPRRQDKKRLSVFLAIGTMILMGALEVLLVFVSRPAYERGISAPVKLFGILSAVMIAIGLLPQYWEIYKLGEVKGISYIFIAIDMLGGILNDLSLAFSREFDGLAAASYTSVPIMESIIIIAALILNPRARRRRQRIAREGSNAEPHSEPEALSMEVCEMRCVGSGVVDFTRSTTLNTVVTDNPCDVNVDIEKKREREREKEETIPEEDQQEKAMVSGGGDKGMGEDVCNLSIVPASGTTTMIEDLDR